MNPPVIPFNRPLLAPGSLDHTRAAFLGSHVSGNGPYGRHCEAWLQRRLRAPRVLLATSCTHALEMSALLLKLGPGDEVILPAYTFVSTANAFALRGATPVFVDVRPDTLNLDETLLAAALSPRTKAIVVVHYAGVACEMDAILALARRHRVPVIEDNAHGLFGAYRDRPLGTLGALATLSFHETKNISCGEGGALLVNRPRLASAAEIIREKGTDRSRFLRGQVDKYTWQSLGSSYVLSDVLAALLFSQLEHWRVIQARRRAIWQTYQRELAAWAGASGVARPHVPAHCRHSFHLYYLILPDSRSRTALIAHLDRLGVNAVFHYVPLHLSPMGRRLGGRRGACPVTERLAPRLVRLPLYPGLSAEEQSRVVAAVQSFQP